MITKVEIIDNTRTGKRFLSDLDSFKNGVSYEFKPGVNIIIGKNGCGKTTLLSLISWYTLCFADGIKSKIPNSLLKMNMRLFDDDDKLYEGINIIGDYSGRVFQYIPRSEILSQGSESVMSSKEAFCLAAKKASTGEGVLDGLGLLFEVMFSGESHQFPIKGLLEIKNGVNDHWSKKISSLLDYYKKNQVDISQEDFEFTVLMDEPDRNLDIDNIKTIYDILSFHKPETQIIATLHNPILIYKLSEIQDINFIEMTPGYLQKIKDFIRLA